MGKVYLLRSPAKTSIFQALNALAAEELLYAFWNKTDTSVGDRLRLSMSWESTNKTHLNEATRKFASVRTIFTSVFPMLTRVRGGNMLPANVQIMC